MGDSSIFRPVGKRKPCPICGRAADCLVASEGSTVGVICSRTESRQRCGRAGFLHLLRDDGPVWSASRQRVLKAARMLGEDSEK